MSDFSSLGLADWLIKQCKQLGINKPTPVQENCMPPILEGKSALLFPKVCGSDPTEAHFPIM
jgi:ATP-dependent RNA helicase DDX49/DBP8